MIWLAVLFALASAVTAAVSTSTQHRATGRAPRSAGTADLLRHLVRRPEWLLALALGPVGFTFHVLALQHGPIALVQPIAVTGIVLAVPLRAAWSRAWPERAEMSAVALTALAIAVLLLTTDVRDAGGPPLPSTLLTACAAAATAVVAALLAARTVRRPAGRALLLGCAAGVLFGLMAVLIEVTQLIRDAHGPTALATSWAPYAVVAAGVGGIAVNQLAYREARLSASMPALNVVNCLVTLGFAHLVLGEVAAPSATAATMSLVALAAMTWGLWRLARLEPAPAGSADVTVADHDVLGGGHLGQAHGAAGVQLLRADADLGAEPELAAVGEPGGGVDEHRR